MRSTTPSGRKSRRLDLHQHHPVYKTGAFLDRATSACLFKQQPDQDSNLEPLVRSET